jgi:hypothetical protein
MGAEVGQGARNATNNERTRINLEIARHAENGLLLTMVILFSTS